MSRYISRPQVIEAIQWDGTVPRWGEIDEWAPGKTRYYSGGYGTLELLAGKDGAQEWVPVPVGHWLVHQPGDLSDIWPVDPHYFEAKYEPAEAVSGVPGGGEPQPGTDDSGPERARQMIDEVTAEHARTWPKPPAWAVRPIDAPVRPVAVGDQPDTPCPTCKGRGWITWGPHFDGFHEVPCPACTDQENPDA